MTKCASTAVGLAWLLATAACGGAGDDDDGTNNPMTFFVTSVGGGSNGGNYGGLDGADAHCQSLAEDRDAGGRTWRAYLSTGSTGPGSAVHARDRIGAGPWLNAAGTMIAADLAALHTDGVDPTHMFDERGLPVPSAEHDVLTGSGTDGLLLSNDVTCANWTSNSPSDQARVGHTNDVAANWNSQHESNCDEEGLRMNNGAGRLYCFAL